MATDPSQGGIWSAPKPTKPPVKIEIGDRVSYAGRDQDNRIWRERTERVYTVVSLYRERTEALVAQCIEVTPPSNLHNLGEADWFNAEVEHLRLVAKATYVDA